MSTDIEIVVPDSKALNSTTDGACKLAEQITSVTTIELHTQAGTALKAVKTAQSNLAAMKDALLDPIAVSVRRIKKLFKGPEDRLERAENFLKGQMIAFEEDQKELARKEQARLDAIANEERRKKEQQAIAAALRAREEAAAGNKEKAEKLQAKADMLADQSANIVAPVVMREPPRIAGIVPRETYSATVTDLRMLIISVAASICSEMRDEELLAHIRKFKQTPIQALKADTVFLNRQAIALKTKGEIFPGVFGVMTRGIAAQGE